MTTASAQRTVQARNHWIYGSTKKVHRHVKKTKDNFCYFYFVYHACVPHMYTVALHYLTCAHTGSSCSNIVILRAFYGSYLDAIFSVFGGSSTSSNKSNIFIIIIIISIIIFAPLQHLTFYGFRLC